MVVTDMYIALSAPQVNAVNNTFLNNGTQTDRFSTVVGAIVTEVRNRIQRRGIPVSKNAMAVPPEMVHHVVWLVLERVQGSLTGFDWTPQQMGLVKLAHDVVDKQLNDRSYPITTPTDPVAGPTVQTGGGVTVVRKGHVTTDFHHLRGM